MTDIALITKIEMVPPEKLVPNPRNSAVHPESQVLALAKSFEKFGFFGSIIVDSSYMIIAGHGRVLAAQLAGMREVPVTIADHLSDDEIRELMLLDNQLATQKETDLEILTREVADLSARFNFADFNFDISGLLSGLDYPGEGLERKDRKSSAEEWDDDQDEPEGDEEFDSAETLDTVNRENERDEPETIEPEPLREVKFDTTCPRCNHAFNASDLKKKEILKVA